MFLFLSKLLPLFLYPLGFVCLLLMVALGLLWKRPRWATGILVTALFILLVGSSEWTAQSLTRSLEFQNIPTGDLPTADAIVILGGATNAPEAPRTWIDLREEGDRVLYGGQLFRAGKAPKLILSGGRVDWWGNNMGPESEDMAQILKFLGVPDAVLIQEPTSLNTRQNAVNVKKILDEQKIRRILLVTSAMHMPRSLAIFRKLGIDTIPAPTDFRITYASSVPPSFQGFLLSALPSAEQLAYTTKALKEYVGLIVYWLRGWV